MKIRSLVAATGIGLALMLALVAGAQAAEIKVLSTNGVKAVLEELAPQFEKATAHRLTIKFAPAARALIKFLTTPAAATVIRAKGMEPG